jgi:hypothetical protein
MLPLCLPPHLLVFTQLLARANTCCFLAIFQGCNFHGIQHGTAANNSQKIKTRLACCRCGCPLLACMHAPVGQGLPSSLRTTLKLRSAWGLPHTALGVGASGDTPGA